MRIKQKRKLRPKLVVASALSIIFVIGITLFIFRPAGNQHPTPDQTRPVNTVDYGPPSAQDKEEAAQNKADTVKENEQQQTPQTTDKISVTINRAGQLGSGQALNIRTQIDGTATGTCQVKLARAGQADVVSVFDIKFEATSATCNGDIPVGQFGSSGEWQLSIVARKDNLTSQAATQTVGINK